MVVETTCESMTDQPKRRQRSTGGDAPPAATSKRARTCCGSDSMRPNSISFVPYTLLPELIGRPKLFQVITVVHVSPGDCGFHALSITGGRVGCHAIPRSGSSQSGLPIRSA